MPTLLVGTWVYENHETNDSVELYSYEELCFSSGNQLSYSNYYDKIEEGNDIYFENNDVEAFYEINGKEVYITDLADHHLLLSGDNHVYSLSDIGNLEMKVITTEKNSINIHNYCKVIGECDVYDDPIIPDYHALLPNVLFHKFTTNNTYVARVDEVTGEISAVSSGTTYVYVHTEMGIAAVRVIVKSLRDLDYEAYLGQHVDSVSVVSGVHNSFTQKHSGNWKQVIMHADKSSYVEKITLKAKDNAWFSTSEISDFLNSHYNPYEWNSTDSKLSYINAPNIKEATTCIYWDLQNKELIFEKKREGIEIGKDNYLPDYKGLLGDVQIYSYSSRNSFVATVDQNTGIVSGIDSGTTFIDVNTSEGEKSLCVIVKVFLADDYEGMIGCSNRQDVETLFAEYGVSARHDYSYEDSYNHYIFDYNYWLLPSQMRESGNWATMKIWMLPIDFYMGFAIQVVLTAKKDVWFKAEEMTEFLSHKYRQEVSLSNETRKVFVNSNYDDAVTVSIIWDEVTKTLSFEHFSFF